MQLYLDEISLNVYKALASETRLEILTRLGYTPLTISELALSMGISKSIMSRHVKFLEDARLIHLSKTFASSDTRKKVYTLSIDRAEIVFPKRIYLPYEKVTTEIKLGYYSDFCVAPSCGLASKDKLIGEMDDPRVFVSNHRIDASLLWLSDGYVEYKIPYLLEEGQILELFDLSLELSSEFPVSNNTWPSDISFTINNICVGTWTCPGNFSDVRGILTPHWWDESYSQYGLLKHLRVNHINTGIDGDKMSDINLSNLHLSDSPFITLRIGINSNAAHKGGLTIFGESFGNHGQNILLSLYYSENAKKL